MEHTNQSLGLETLSTERAAASRKKPYERPLVTDWGSVAQVTGGENEQPGDLSGLNGSQPF